MKKLIGLLAIVFVIFSCTDSVNKRYREDFNRISHEIDFWERFSYADRLISTLSNDSLLAIIDTLDALENDFKSSWVVYTSDPEGLTSEDKFEKEIDDAEQLLNRIHQAKFNFSVILTLRKSKKIQMYLYDLKNR